jgi:hypothetical protein
MFNDVLSQAQSQGQGEDDGWNYMFESTGDLTLNTLLATQFALHAYKAEHGAYPAALSDLVPNYLSHLPEDPFSNHQPLIYRRTADKYLLYSIGPDAKDNGGTPLVQSRSEARSNALFGSDGEDATGDIVAGVNY